MGNSEQAVLIEGDGLVLREWSEDDLPAMVDLFDEAQVAYWTPLVTPFDLAEARAYLDKVRGARAEGTRLHLAITTDGRAPLGEVLVTSTGTLGYAVGSAHRGQRLALRATRLLTAYAHDTLGLPRLRLQIEDENGASVAVAKGAGYRRIDEEERLEEKGRPLVLHSWVHARQPER
ncbi:GNAT family N-acetyltransferase [Streptomyces sp. NBC_01304]|uniref:GNAT family N-acetyltransferase n=1 Tax=Streptomyces sp. NBC_01304 TaxID=2903818 RepID=UPI002E1399B1|nr:GNAT family N-acetyltransferase [Streptomyces sp. NBC_01304]